MTTKTRKARKVYRPLRVSDCAPTWALTDEDSKRRSVDGIMGRYQQCMPPGAADFVRSLLEQFVIGGDPLALLPLSDALREGGCDQMADDALGQLAGGIRLQVFADHPTKAARALSRRWQDVDRNDQDSMRHVRLAIVAEYLSRRKA